MTLSNAIQVFAGIMILVALILGATVSEAVGFWLMVFIAVNLIQSAFTGFCPAAMVLKKMPFIKA
ncbi:YgaP family membrane protein [Thiothrix subterranea]|jgi:hypothetical protein|uniref:DUF2892 domain-containing protein n=1 Tax=Thiothrix subterranea TaxID=2735563 RepID=A0AA51MQ79_9GAMM|nr:DUF2892 domain-containing protein [Thiothrix subterranea]MDQ5767073.1 DUF2892 domain-containing protein [Thiothrix subterranea]QQZ28635.1 DUF2892 domain-containing protein [Thiothrix subterranea]WML88065.1 DUF2892 domain-containing protein [Thiothrix subterranea]